MKHSHFAISLAAGALALSAVADTAPVPTIADMTVIPQGRTIEVQYKLNDFPGIVTVDVLTNSTAGGWASIGENNFAGRMAGDAFSFVKKSESADDLKRIFWRPHETWPEQYVASGKAKIVLTAWATNAPPNWIVVPLGGVSKKRYYVYGVPGNITNRTYKVDNLVLRKVPAAGVQFRMGKSGYYAYNTVTFTKDFYLGVYELTRGQYSKMLGGTAPSEEDAAKPQGGVSHNFRGHTFGYFYTSTNPAKSGNKVLAGSYIDTMRTKCKMLVDFPSMAEWEYAGRAGIEPEKFSSAWLYERAWVWDNCEGVAQEVGLKKPNNWGFYDMIGNLVEMTLDIEGGTYNGETDPHGKVFQDGVDNVSTLMWFKGYGCNRTYDYYGADYSLRSDIYSGYTGNGGSKNSGHGSHGLRLWAAPVVCD